jgi:1-deoxy-D-xylulose-5-phosphate reductoisomerase
LAFDAIGKGGNMPCILNAANEIAVSEFLKDKIKFLEMSSVIEQCMEKVSFVANPTYEDYVGTDIETRRKAIEIIG